MKTTATLLIGGITVALGLMTGVTRAGLVHEQALYLLAAAQLQQANPADQCQAAISGNGPTTCCVAHGRR